MPSAFVSTETPQKSEPRQRENPYHDASRQQLEEILRTRDSNERRVILGQLNGGQLVELLGTAQNSVLEQVVDQLLTRGEQARIPLTAAKQHTNGGVRFYANLILRDLNSQFVRATIACCTCPHPLARAAALANLRSILAGEGLADPRIHLLRRMCASPERNSTEVGNFAAVLFNTAEAVNDRRMRDLARTIMNQFGAPAHQVSVLLSPSTRIDQVPLRPQPPWRFSSPPPHLRPLIDDIVRRQIDILDRRVVPSDRDQRAAYLHAFRDLHDIGSPARPAVEARYLPELRNDDESEFVKRLGSCLRAWEFEPIMYKLQLQEK